MKKLLNILEYVPEFAAETDRICADLRWLKERGLG